MNTKVFYYSHARNSLDAQKVIAASVEFSPTHIIFVNPDGSLNVAVRASDVAEVWEDTE